jgi:hypothetical protein
MVFQFLQLAELRLVERLVKLRKIHKTLILMILLTHFQWHRVHQSALQTDRLQEAQPDGMLELDGHTAATLYQKRQMGLQR